MATITIMPSGKTVEASEGTTLLTAIRSADEKLLPDFDAANSRVVPSLASTVLPDGMIVIVAMVVILTPC